ncbi:hypothetical protein I3843_06G070800 [Carya illinoinensis]|uniref:Uncharacterized protein n=1 Tax=Carya illinoinensis TaxID=32201 RepID=A0A922ERT0_CARIL|nr:hypothetical protein I3842_06G076600 [Carya illinoinensis]KAG7974893.1 hypothetical protein I3843_06G070800 [Carya illinoinensis]
MHGDKRHEYYLTWLRLYKKSYNRSDQLRLATGAWNRPKLK